MITVKQRALDLFEGPIAETGSTCSPSLPAPRSTPESSTTETYASPTPPEGSSMADATVIKLAGDLESALRADVEHVHRVAGTMAAGIGEAGTVVALQAGYFMARALPRERLESMLVAALYALAAEKTGTQVLARTRRQGGTQ